MHDNWQRIEVEPAISFAVPPGATRLGGTAVDSNAGIFQGEGYRITWDLGRFGERLGDYEQEPCFRRRTRSINGGSFVEVEFTPTDEEFGWARIVQIALQDGRTLTIRVSCVSRESCDMADTIFQSIVVGSGK